MLSLPQLKPATRPFSSWHVKPPVHGSSHGESGEALSAALKEHVVADRDLTKTYTRTQFVAKLRRLADAIESERAFAIQVAGERLRIPAHVEFNIEHERLGGQHELEFQLLWASGES